MSDNEELKLKAAYALAQWLRETPKQEIKEAWQRMTAQTETEKKPKK